MAYDSNGNRTVSCTFTNNKARYDGGALYVPTDQDMKVESCTFEKNEAGADGGAICACAHTDATIRSTAIKDNKAGSTGGGVYLGALSASDHSLRNVTITNNYAKNGGGGIFCNTQTGAAGDVAVHDKVIIKDNLAGGGKVKFLSWELNSPKYQSNALMNQAAGKKALFYTKSDFNSGASEIYVSSTDRSDIAVVDLKEKKHENAFRSDRGRKLYRGSFHNYTLYLDDWDGGSAFSGGTIALIAGGAAILIALIASVIIVKKRKKKAAVNAEE